MIVAAIIFGIITVIVGIPDLILHAVAEEPSKLVLIFVGFLIPAATGMIATFLLTNAAFKDDGVSKRVMLLATTLVLLVFTDVYASAYKHSKGLDRQLAPNGAFVLGLSMTLVLLPRD